MACTSKEPALDHITIGQVSAMSLAFAPVIFADALGYFREEHLEIEVLEFDGSGVLLPQLASKRVLIGYPNPDALILSHQPGHEPLPLRFFYNMCRRSVWEFAVPVDGAIHDLADLRGKRVGVGSLSWSPLVFTRAMLRDIGIDPAKDIQLIPIGLGSSALHALTTHQVDALNLFDTEHATIEASGARIRRIPLTEPYADLISNGFIAHEETIRARAPLLAAFGRAVAKGTVACAANMQACIRAFWKQYPNQRPKTGSSEDQMQRALAILGARYPKFLYTHPGETLRFGEYPRSAMPAFVEALYRGGQLSTRNIAVDKLYTNDLVQAFNQFDTAAVAEQARALPR